MIERNYKAEYQCWQDMRRRCLNPKRRDYARYGGRGIKVCDRWASFATFLADMGPRPSPKHSLDRIDNLGHYEPGNCKWATAAEQTRNRRSNLHVTIDGVTKVAADWEKEYNLPRCTIRDRLRSGWSGARLLLPRVKGVKSINALCVLLCWLLSIAGRALHGVI